MLTPPQHESYWKRADHDARSALNTIQFRLCEVGLFAVGSGLSVAWLLWTDHRSLYLVTITPIVAGPTVVSFGVLLLFAWHLFRAPYRQRNEAHDYLNRLDEDNVGRAIKHLKKLGLLKRLCTLEPLGAMNSVTPEKVFDLEEVKVLHEIQVIETSIGYDRSYVVTHLGREVFKRACSGEAF